MSYDIIHQDPTFPAMVMEILDNMLSRSENPGQLSKYLTEEIRELTGARCVLLIECMDDNHNLLAVNPERRREWAESPETKLLYEASHALNKTSLWEGTEPSDISSLLSENDFAVSIAAPLLAQGTRIGAMLLLGLPDKLHIQTEIQLVTTLSKVLALMLRNALLFRNQEQTIEERTKELRLHSVTIDNMKDAVFWINSDSSFQQINNSACTMLGYSEEELSQLRLIDVCPELTMDGWQTSWLNLTRYGAVEAEMIFRHQTGREIPVDISATYFEFEGKAYNCAIARDITDRKRVEKALLESEERLRNVFTNSPFPIVVHAEDGRIIMVNETWTQLSGYSHADIPTIADWTAKVYGEKHEEVRELIEPLYNIKERVDEGEFTIKTKDGNTIVWDFSSAPLGELPSGQKLIVSMAKDVTGKKIAAEEKQNMEIKLQQSQKMESIGTLAGGIAHDFNNILTAILGYTEMARDASQPGSTISEDLDEVLEAGNRAKSLVRQILAFSRQDNAGRIHLQPASIIKETIALLRPSLPSTIDITQDIDAVTGLVFVDPTQLNQILMNLCTNAFHAMEKTGGKLGISMKEVSLSSDDLIHEPDVACGNFIQFSISDSGPGIAPAIKNKIFDPYFTTKKVGKGTGMGLATVHGIVKSYGGVITVYSELGEGTVFHVFLPVENKGKILENEINDQIPIGRERILFVDDEEILATMGKAMLERLGYHVTVRANSLEALETFQNQPDQFDLIITDQTMPGMTGSDLSRRMLQIRPDIPIILCTGYSTIISEEKAKFMGIKEFALKPFTKKDIGILIRKVLDPS
ncbi:hybrid sensor histidine kinase/response regulator [Desulforhopalus sp. 52FAK]